jgi:Sulfotransferase domain
LNDPNFTLVRYEDMLRQPRDELARIARFLGIDSSDERLAHAIERSSLDRMRSLEKAQAAKWLTTARTRQDRPFVRAAKNGTWQTDLPRDSVALIEAAWWPIMNTLGYELASSPQYGSGQPVVSKEVWAAALTERAQRQLLSAHRPCAAGHRSADVAVVSRSLINTD